MYFQDEFEYEATNGQTYFIEVEGSHYDDETGAYTEISRMVFSNENGDVVDKTDDVYSELVEEATYRDYEVEHHTVDTSFYGDHDSID